MAGGLGSCRIPTATSSTPRCEAIGVPFELAIVAGEIGSYKPAHTHWEVFYETTGADRRGHVHVAQSLFHDIEPANELGIPSIWINRLGEPDDPRPTVTLPGVDALADALDSLVPVSALMSSLRARCPNCRTFTAVAIGDGYECHRCGSTFAAGLVRVPAAWGSGGEGMAEGARVALPYPEVAVVERDTLDEQTEAIAEALPARPVAVGGCCCTHVGAATGVARRVERLAVIWIDSHGDLNTPETSPSGNLWGMPFRMLLDGGVVAPEDAALVGARNLDPPEVAFMERAGIDDSIDRALAGTDAAYVALDLDVLDPSEVDVLIPEPDGPSADEIEALLRDVAGKARIAGMGVTGVLATERDAALAARMLAAAGF